MVVPHIMHLRLPMDVRRRLSAHIRELRGPYARIRTSDIFDLLERGLRKKETPKRARRTRPTQRHHTTGVLDS